MKPTTWRDAAHGLCEERNYTEHSRKGLSRQVMCPFCKTTVDGKVYQTFGPCAGCGAIFGNRSLSYRRQPESKTTAVIGGMEVRRGVNLNNEEKSVISSKADAIAELNRVVALNKSLEEENKRYRSALQSILARARGGTGAAVVVSVTTLSKIAEQALNP